MSYKPMLAATADLSVLTTAFMYSIKKEGVRGEFTPEGLLTRNLKPFNNQLMYERFQALETFCMENNIYLQGEFYVHGWSFKRIDSCCRGDGNIDAMQLEFHVFDCYMEWDAELQFQSRYEAYVRYVGQYKAATNHDHIKSVEQYWFTSEEDVRKCYAWVLEQGYEGICFKRGDLAYKHGRSTVKQGYFVRIKPEDTYDGIVLGFIERQHNLNESQTNELGYLYKPQDKDKKLGAGMVQSALVYTPQIDKVHKVSMTRKHTEPDLARLWDNQKEYIGKGIQWVGIPIKDQDVPRSPRYDEWRLDLTPTFMVHEESDSLFICWDEAQVEQLLQEPCMSVISMDAWFERLAEGYSLGK